MIELESGHASMFGMKMSELQNRNFSDWLFGRTMVTLSLPVFLKGKVHVDGIYTPRGGESTGRRTPTTGSPSSLDDMSPADVQCSGDETYSAFSLLQNRYEMLDGKSILLGSGASGCVWSATCKVGYEAVAVKTIGKPAYGSRLSRESDLLRRVQNIPGVVKLLAVFGDEDNDIVVMELCKGKDLQQWNIGQLNIGHFKSIMRDLIVCLIGIHRRGISHGDIRLENVIANINPTSNKTGGGPCIRLIDFGSSVSGTAEACNDYISTGKLLFELLAGSRAASDDAMRRELLPMKDHGASDLISLLLGATSSNYSVIGARALNHAWLLH